MRRALDAEWTKLRTTSGPFWLLAGIVMMTVTVGVAMSYAGPCSSEDCTPDPVKTSLSGVYLGQAVVAVLGVLVMGGEYTTGMVRVTLAAMPRRTSVLTAKAVLVAVLVAAAATVAVLASLVAGRLIIDDEGPVVRAGTGTILYLALVGLLSLGVATAVRDSAAAIGTVLGLLYVWPILAAAVPDKDVRERLREIGPMDAGLAIQATRGLDRLPIGPWQGLGVLALWAAGALLLGGLLLHRRDA